MNSFVVLVCLLSFGSSAVFSDTKVLERREDSYLSALHNSHGQSNEFTPGAVPDNFGATHLSAGYDYKPYGPPTLSPGYYPPAATPHFPHPQPSFPVYGPPPTQAPRGDWLWDKFHLKFDLFTLGKILLKLLIFKKIVKFIGVICLLMFLPTLIEKKKAQHDEGGDGGYGEEMFRNLKPIDESTRFNELTTFVLTSIESFADKQALEVNCPHGGISCRFTRMLDIVDKSYPWKRVAKWVRSSNKASVTPQKVLPTSENQLDEQSTGHSDDSATN